MAEMTSAVVFVEVTMRTYSDEMFVERHRIFMRPLCLTFFCALRARYIDRFGMASSSAVLLTNLRVREDAC